MQCHTLLEWFMFLFSPKYVSRMVYRLFWQPSSQFAGLSYVCPSPAAIDALLTCSKKIFMQKTYCIYAMLKERQKIVERCGTVCFLKRILTNQVLPESFQPKSCVVSIGLHHFIEGDEYYVRLFRVTVMSC